ncbi:helix-turn-helix domain-containing protein [Uliginosibacterium sp. 31-12]|uniref:helix-turn-helix domain-containing protein n=1 Tax=Uliginosibacterium sp. 31-12 TaxID=3062781 RepID=UPI0026E1347F|nr:helix-turn-helix domain-containing protein [Uliginosibacterium sp. 31-12]MDO6385604.1 helix-turn-helix domain-containing protein [Uliginosibacterium sp. 31-12]
MRIAAQDTSIRAFRAHNLTGAAAGQREKILKHIEAGAQRDWSIGELANELGWQKSTVSARLNELLACGELQERPKRKDRVSGVLIRPVALPAVQTDLFAGVRNA